MNDSSSAPDTRTRILRAALELFAERGYDGTTTREVAIRACVAELTLFRHFGNKQTLLQNALAPLALIPEGPQRNSEWGSNPEILFAGLARRLWEGMMGSRRRLLQTMVGEAARRPELNQSMSQMPREFADRIGGLLAVLQQEGKVRPGNPRLMALAFLGMFFAVAVGGESFSCGSEEFSPEETMQTYVDVFLNGVLSRSGGQDE